MKTNKKLNFNKLLIISLLGLVLSATSCNSKITSTRNNSNGFKTTVIDGWNATGNSLNEFGKKIKTFSLKTWWGRKHWWNNKTAPVDNENSKTTIIVPLKSDTSQQASTSYINSGDPLLGDDILPETINELTIIDNNSKEESVTKPNKVMEKIYSLKKFFTEKYKSLKTKKDSKVNSTDNFIDIDSENDTTNLLKLNIKENNSEIKVVKVEEVEEVIVETTKIEKKNKINNKELLKKTSKNSIKPTKVAVKSTIVNRDQSQIKKDPEILNQTTKFSVLLEQWNEKVDNKTTSNSKPVKKKLTKKKTTSNLTKVMNKIKTWVKPKSKPVENKKKTYEVKFPKPITL